MQKCSNCNTSFKWSEIYKSVMWGYKPIQCDHCDSNFKITFLSRLIVSVFSILPVLLVSSMSLSPFNHIVLTIIFGVTIAIIFTLFIPYLVKYVSD